LQYTVIYSLEESVTTLESTPRNNISGMLFVIKISIFAGESLGIGMEDVAFTLRPESIYTVFINMQKY